jgi:hypothetical protein
MPSPGDLLFSVEVRVDGVLQANAHETRDFDSGITRLGELRITIPRRDCMVSVIAHNRNGASEPASINVHWRGPETDPKPTLYVLAIGISNYKQKDEEPLQFAAKDAEDFIGLTTKLQDGLLYGHVFAHILQNNNATRKAVLDELDWIRHAVTNEDIAMVFLAGHGKATPDGHYRFLPYDYDSENVRDTTIKDSDLQDYLTDIVGKKVFFFDTCYSGAVGAISMQPIVDKFANELKAPENGVIVLTSTSATDVSKESDEWNNGAFTKAVLDGLRGEAAPKDTVIMENKLEAYVDATVPNLTHNQQHPSVAHPHTIPDFPIAERLQ